jgi:excisionase family DNA binding protein
METQDSDIMTPSEACRFLRVSLPTLRDAVRRGQIPSIRIGNRWRVLRAALLRYLEGSAEQQPKRPIRTWANRLR